eukprot:Protomagalhaensia_sp_Gyna_25__2895@NODE_2692_length_943_cov_18_599558_g2246_i0_p1_GENE_NODE_2692_length_943_cov_18_599558_g2246_i0NODE_2692_length_943_cov_18_599558_g2246_i0_p1_ORF_typecomplete_len212_score37_62NAD_binding_10/PF13460_6/2_6e23Epimerase/PF01370_21/2_8e08NmrA/PF05368_13/5e07LpxI_N/PF17930_1/0_00014RmlD_sub_bind/PF04321_17/0_00013DapB_N/PF01113_20/0_00017Shikimate_DH/PF01488_20/0_0021ApbA/PF02558_16/0_0027TrkA_N/PF02254_18/0_01TPMT/PF05724_11/0_012Methyltransf_31/PF13847_6/0_036Ross
MKIAVIAGNGRVGRLVCKEAAARGHDVTAIVRSGDAPADNIKVITKDLFDLKAEDLKPFDVVVDAFAVWSPDKTPLHVSSLALLCDLLANTKIRLVVVGGAGSLYVDPGHKEMLMEQADFPQEYMPVASSMGEGLKNLRKRDDVIWTYLSPALFFEADGPHTGKYVLGSEEYIKNENGKSVISYADYAIAMVDEIENGKYIKKRFTVVGNY